MITSSQKTNYQYGRKLLVLPVAAALVAVFAFNYKPTAAPVTRRSLLEKTITVVIDAGHGGKSGAVASDGTYEGDLALAVAQKVKELNKNDRIQIILTRDSREDVDLRKRSDFANARKPDLFISIHLNNAPDAGDQAGNAKNGFDVFISKKNTTFYPENKILGAILLNYFSNIYPVEKRIRQQDEGIWVLDNSQCPSVLVECGYLSNKKDLAFIKKTANQEKVAQGILQSVEQYAMQKESPDFDERKKQVSDTTIPDLKLSKDANGKISGTIDGLAIKTVSSMQWTEQNGEKRESLAFVVDNNNIIVLSKERTVAFEKKYGALWTEFLQSFPDISKMTNANQTTFTARPVLKPVASNPAPANKAEFAARPILKPVETNPAPANKAEFAGEPVFETAEIEPAFPGGQRSWQKYLESHLNVNAPIEQGASEGSYTVWVMFLVAKNGDVSNIKTLSKQGFGMEEEVLKLIGTGPKWLPARQNGHVVNAYKKQPVTFVVQAG